MVKLHKMTKEEVDALSDPNEWPLAPEPELPDLNQYKVVVTDRKILLVDKASGEEISGINRTAPSDPRFKNPNQTKRCFQNYIDYHRCIRAKGEEYPACKQFQWMYTDSCPTPWTEKWDEWVAKNRFPADLDPPAKHKNKHAH